MAQGELDLATTLAELRAFEQRYLRAVGIRMAELDEIEAAIARIISEQSPQNHRMQERARKTHSRAQASARARNTVLDGEIGERFEPTPEMKQIFRDLARQIHPDLAADDQEIPRRTTLMAEANAAYQRGDIDRLHHIVTQWRNAPELIKGEGLAIDLVRVIRKIAQLNERLNAIHEEHTYLCHSDLNQLRHEVGNAEADGRGLMDEMALELDARISVAKRNLKILSHEGVRS